MVRDVRGEPSLQSIGAARTRGPRPADRRVAVGLATRAAALIGAPALLVGVLAWPMLLTNEGFNEDWIHHLWYIWNQSAAIRDSHHPSFFLNYSGGVFYPQYAFYGGTLYALAGTLSLALGNSPIAAYVASYLLGFAAAYGGWYWLSRMAGLGRWWAHLPGVTFITAAYYLTLIYARGDLPEFLAVSAIPLLIASGLSVLRAERLHAAPALALTAGAVVFFGSHSITILWGSTLMIVIGAAALACIPQTRSWVKRRSVLRVASLVVPSLLLSAWFLLPAIAYESQTFVSNDMHHWETLMGELMFLVAPGRLFTISRAPAAGPGTDFALSLPVLAIGWSLLSVFANRRGRAVLRDAWARLLLLCAGLMAALIVMTTHAGLILALPRQYILLQFTYRLESYVILLACGAVLAGLVMTRNTAPRRRLWSWALVPVTAVAIVGAIQQSDAYPRGGADRNEVNLLGTRPAGMSAGLIDYTDVNLPLRVDPYRSPPTVTFRPKASRDEHVSDTVHLRPGEWVDTNVAGGPETVSVRGARIVGRDLQGHDVLEIGPSRSGSPSASAAGRRSRWTEVISLSPANPLPVALGRVLSLVGIAWLLAVFAALAARRLRAGTETRVVRAG
jgi:hypothetical protein